MVFVFLLVFSCLLHYGTNQSCFAVVVLLSCVLV